MQQSGFANIGIVGAGAFGSALGEALTRTKTQVLYYDKEPKLSTTGNIEDLIASCDVLFVCVPSWEVENAAKSLHDNAHPTKPCLVIATSKGVGKGFATADQILTEHLPKHYAVGMLGGSLIAEEIDHESPASGVLGLSDMGYFEPLRAQLAQAKIYVKPAAGTKSVALCGALKNIYAIALGMCDGLRLGLNAKGWMAVAAAAEMRRLVTELGGDARLVDTVAGLGDLISSSFGSDSFNYRIGKSLAEGIVNEHIKSEGLVALSELSHKVNLTDYPIAHHIERASFHYAKPEKLIDLFSV